MLITLFTDEFLCSDGTTIIKKTQLCDDVDDCPLRNTSPNTFFHSHIAEDEGNRCPGIMYIIFYE